MTFFISKNVFAFSNLPEFPENTDSFVQWYSAEPSGTERVFFFDSTSHYQNALTGGSVSIVSGEYRLWPLFQYATPCLSFALIDNAWTCDSNFSGGNVSKLSLFSSNLENNIYTNVDLYNFSGGLEFDSNFIPPQTIGITHSTPVNNATDVNAFATFTGTYDNDGTYNIVYYKIHNYDCTNCEDELLACIPAGIGTAIEYTCNFSLATNTHYGITPALVSTSLENAIWDTEGPYNITTGLVYEVNTPAVSSTCGTFEFGCHIESALSWFFGVNQNTLNRFGNLTLSNKIPFSYMYDIPNLYEELFNDTPQNINVAIAFGSSNLTLLSTEKLEEVPFQGLVRTTMGALMYFFLAMYLYNKLLKVHNKESEVYTFNVR